MKGGGEGEGGESGEGARWRRRRLPERGEVVEDAAESAGCVVAHFGSGEGGGKRGKYEGNEKRVI